MDEEQHISSHQGPEWKMGGLQRDRRKSGGCVCDEAVYILIIMMVTQIGALCQDSQGPMQQRINIGQLYFIF